jgi:hypothetical protein
MKTKSTNKSNTCNLHISKLRETLLCQGQYGGDPLSPLIFLMLRVYSKQDGPRPPNRFDDHDDGDFDQGDFDCAEKTGQK